MYNASMKAVVKIKDHSGHTSTDKIDYTQNNEDIRINIDNNGHHKQYNLTTNDIGTLMDNLNSSNLEDRLLQMGKAMSAKKTRKHKSRKHKSRKHKSRKHKSRKHKTRKDKGKHHKKHKNKNKRVRFRTPTPYPHNQL
jgi:hypothetical protein